MGSFAPQHGFPADGTGFAIHVLQARGMRQSLSGALKFFLGGSVMARFVFVLLVLGLCLMFARRLWLARVPLGGRGPDRQLAEHGLEGCRLLVSMIRALQRHRGLAIALLGGNRGLEPMAQALRVEVHVLFLDLARVARRESDMPWPCFTYNELTLLRHQWENLVAASPTMGEEECALEHARIIEQLLSWLASMGEARIGLAFPFRLPLDLALNYACRLPELAECLGKARVLAAAAANGDSFAESARGGLIVLADAVESLLARIGDPVWNPVATDAAIVVRRWTRLIHDLGSTPSDAVAARDCEERAAVATESVFAWIEDCGRELAKILVGEEPRKSGVIPPEEGEGAGIIRPLSLIPESTPCPPLT